MMGDMKLWAPKRQQFGFTIVELLIVIVVIAILAAITVVAYNGVQNRARQAKAQSDIASVLRLIEAYNAEKGYYPVTTETQGASLTPGDYYSATARTDANCSVGGAGKTAQWVPDVTAALPQSSGGKGVNGFPGCYMYASNGSQYVLSAWNMLPDVQNSTMYRRLGFREMDGANDHQNMYFLCNHGSVDGTVGGTYNANNDYYKHSLTVSNITTCNETLPPGA
jgi:prepilin-type N-terminal cleavage/methylation domain-containing protein